MGLDILDWDRLQKQRAAEAAARGEPPPALFAPTTPQAQEDRAAIGDAVGAVGGALAWPAALAADTITLPGQAVVGAGNLLNRGLNAFGANVPMIPTAPTFLDRLVANRGSAPAVSAPGTWTPAPASVTDPAIPPTVGPSPFMLQMQQFARTLGPGGAGAEKVSAAGGKSSVDGYEKKIQKMQDDLEAESDASKNRIALAIKNQKEPTPFNSRDAFNALDASTPMPEDKNRMNRVIAHLPFMVNGRMDFTGAQQRAAELTQHDQTQMNLEKQNRRDDLFKQLGFQQHDIDQLNKINEFQNAKDVGVAKAFQFGPELKIAAMGNMGNIAMMRTQERNAEMMARATRANSPGALQQAQLGAIAAAVANGTLPEEQGKAAVAHVLQVPTMQPPKLIDPKHTELTLGAFDGRIATSKKPELAKTPAVQALRQTLEQRLLQPGADPYAELSAAYRQLDSLGK